MSIKITLADVLGIAQAMERDAAGFYRILSLRVADDEVRELFDHLSSDERRHEDSFRRFEESLPPAARSDAFLGDEQSYYRTVAEEALAVHRRLDALGDETTEMDLDHALDVALAIEIRGCEFYERLLRFLSRRDGARLKDIIADELAHRDAIQRVRDKRQPAA